MLPLFGFGGIGVGASFGDGKRLADAYLGDTAWLIYVPSLDSLAVLILESLLKQL